jgi:hypothetical protein
MGARCDWRRPFVLLTAFALVGCSQECKPGMFLATVTLTGSTVDADVLMTEIAFPETGMKLYELGTHPDQTPVLLVETDLPSGYPVNQDATWTLSAFAQRVLVGTSAPVLTHPNAACTAFSVTVTPISGLKPPPADLGP